MAENPIVLLETTSGDILIELYPDKAPETVKNFLQYVDDGFYNNTIFHRVIPGFMIQGEERTRHHCHGPHDGAAQRVRPVLHQSCGQ